MFMKILNLSSVFAPYMAVATCYSQTHSSCVLYFQIQAVPVTGKIVKTDVASTGSI